MLYQLCLKVDYRTPPICVQQFSSPNRDGESGGQRIYSWRNESFSGKQTVSRALLPLHIKTNIIQNITINMTFCITLIFYRRAVVKQEHYLTHLLSEADSVF